MCSCKKRERDWQEQLCIKVWRVLARLSFGFKNVLMNFISDVWILMLKLESGFPQNKVRWRHWKESRSDKTRTSNGCSSEKTCDAMKKKRNSWLVSAILQYQITWEWLPVHMYLNQNLGWTLCYGSGWKALHIVKMNNSTDAVVLMGAKYLRKAFAASQYNLRYRRNSALTPGTQPQKFIRAMSACLHPCLSAWMSMAETR